MELMHSIHIILIRHGITEYNVQKKYIGLTDEPVIKERLSIEYSDLLETLRNQKIDKIYSSDLRRCQQTTQFLYPDRDIQLDCRLREINFGDWEGRTYDELVGYPAYRKWLTNWEEEYIPNGESGYMFQERIVQFLQKEILKVSNIGKNIALITHGGVIRHMIQYLSENTDFWDTDVQFGKAIVLNVNLIGGSWKCMSSSVVPIVGKENT